MKKPVSLVLSCGGARGLAHIGVIEILEKYGFEIKSIAGSSIGAIIGGFYAAGKLDVYKKWVASLERIDIIKLMDFTFSPQGFIRGEKVFKELELLIQDCDIKDLPIPFSAIATDLINNKEVVFNEGSLYKAIRASAAIPTIMKPVIIDHKEFVDGGVLNPVPIEHVQRFPNDILVVVNVNAPIEYHLPNSCNLTEKENSNKNKIDFLRKKWGIRFIEKKQPISKKLGFFDLLVKSFDVMQDRLTDVLLEKHQPDILVEISRNTCNTFDFYKANEMIDLGKESFKKAYENYQDKVNISVTN